MNPKQIKERVERYTDMTFKDELILDFINEAVNKLGAKNYLIDTINMEFEGKDFYELPKEWIRVIKVEDIDKEVYYYNFLIDGNQIRFKDEGNYRIFAERHPFVVDDMNEDLPMHRMLAECIITYVKASIRMRNSEQNEAGWRQREEFWKESELAYRTLKRGQDNPVKWVVRRKA